MPENKVDKEYWEENWSNFKIPFEINRKKEHQLYNTLKKIIPENMNTLIEVGCASGGWMAFFHRHFNLKVSGVEYAKDAYKKTEENLNILNIPAHIFLDDIFSFHHEPFDIVYSGGFIEHFDDLGPIMNKIDQLCKPVNGIVITVIPNLHGLNRWISKIFRPKVAAQHRPIPLDELIKIHEEKGFKTLYANYGRPLYILPPIYLNVFWKKYPRISLLMNSPVHVLNLITGICFRWLKFYPKFSFISKNNI